MPLDLKQAVAFPECSNAALPSGWRMCDAKCKTFASILSSKPEHDE